MSGPAMLRFTGEDGSFRVPTVVIALLLADHSERAGHRITPAHCRRPVVTRGPKRRELPHSLCVASIFVDQLLLLIIYFD